MKQKKPFPFKRKAAPEPEPQKPVDDMSPDELEDAIVGLRRELVEAQREELRARDLTRASAGASAPGPQRRRLFPPKKPRWK